jgi:hypothetical protein
MKSWGMLMYPIWSCFFSYDLSDMLYLICSTGVSNPHRVNISILSDVAHLLSFEDVMTVLRLLFEVALS